MRTDQTRYYEVWIGRLRAIVELDDPKIGSTFSFTPCEYPRQRHRDGHLIRKHFLKRGRWHVSERISRKEKRAIAIVVNQAHAFIHQLILANGAMAHLAVNANIEHGTAWDVD